MKYGIRPVGRNMKPHIPVLLNQVIAGLQVAAGKRYIDATFGGGGHAREIERRGGKVLGIDTDPDTDAVHGNFRDIKKIAQENGFSKVSGILFDLGVSSHQLDTPERGFSYRFTNAPLDLRMDQSKGETAAQLINRLPESELYDIFVRYAEEELARPIAHAIYRARAVKPIETTGDLVKIIGNRPGVLSRIFQALRIAVNDEFGALKEGLAGAEELLEQEGRLVVLTFHSLEDRIVKKFLERSGFRRITKKPIVATQEEKELNPRARSAKLRIGEKL